MYLKRSILSSVLMALLTAHAFAATEERVIRQSYSLNPNGVIELSNVNGDITIRGWDKNEVDLKATKRGPAENLDLIEIQIDSTPERLSIETKYPRKKRDTGVSVTYELMVPKTADLDSINNVNGEVEVIGVEGKIFVDTVNGSAEVSGTRAPVHAQTVNGNITVKWNDFPDSGTVKMETVNGSLEVELPANANADVRASSLNGSVRTDFPVTVHGWVSRKLEGRIGSGGPTIDLNTVNGAIEILKSK